MAGGYVLSDLHLFAARSSAARYRHELEAVCGKADFIVLNGDIFDFLWSRLPSGEAALDAAIAWLTDLTKAHPRCHFYYIMGNHDRVQPFAARLDRDMTAGNFSWSPTHFKLGPNLFLHGDLPLGPDSPFAAVLLPMPDAKNIAHSLAYGAIVAARLHRGAEFFTRKSFLAPRLYKSLTAHDKGEMAGVTDIYFGHTHLAFENFSYKGYRFHNTGAAIRGVRSRILAVRS